MFGPPSSPPETRNASSAAAGLLPAFAPQSSSPQPVRDFLRPKFAIYQDPAPQPTFLPTPLPTSEANAPASSSPPASPDQQTYRSGSPVPLKTLIMARVPLSGTSVTLGRSSKSSTFALRARNKLASRVHARLLVNSDNFVVIECLGWNGLKVSVPQESGKRQEYEVARGQILNIERTDGITIDIHGDKTLIEFDNDAEETQEELWNHTDEQVEEPPAKDRETSPQKITDENYEVTLPKKRKLDDETSKHPMALSIADFANKFYAKTSDSPRAKPTSEEPPKIATQEQLVPTVDTRPKRLLGAPLEVLKPTQLEVPRPVAFDQQHAEHELKTSTASTNSMRGFTSDVLSEKETTPEPSSHNSAESSKSASQTPTTTGEKRKRYQELSLDVRHELENVAVNFIAFSRLSAVPLATVRKASTQLQGLPKSQVREIIREVKCIGMTDAQPDDSGRLPEDEYYYIPELDEDESRRSIVQNTRGHRSLRSCRKTRKQYFYRPLNLTE